MYNDAQLPRGPLPSALLVRQHICFDTGHCSYVVACARTRAAALIDPTPSLAADLQRTIASLGLRVRFVLETRPPSPEPPQKPGRRYDDLLARLGVAPEGGRTPSTPQAPWWSELPRVGPLASPPSPNACCESVLLQAGDTHVGIRTDGRADCATTWTIGGSLHTPMAGRICCQVRVALGAFHVQVLPLTDRAGVAVAFHVGGFVFSGAELCAGGGTDGASEVLLALPPDTVVYPIRMRAGLCISSVAQETRWRDRMPASTPLLLGDHFRLEG